MGGGTFDSSAYRSYSHTISAKSSHQIFKQHEIHPRLNPKDVVRESRDSVDNPSSTAVILALDVTGSMGMIATKMVKEKLGDLMTLILETKPVSDPHLMFMGVGDIHCDQAPLQVSQFEADNRIVDQLEMIWLEGRGGGNDSESYDLPWWFAANRTSIDCFEKRGVKGYLFTFGDECVPYGASQHELSSVVGSVQAGYDTASALAEAQTKYHCFHLMIEEGNYMSDSRRRSRAVESWRSLMNRRAICVDNINHIPEIITSIMLVNEGADIESVLSKFSGSVLASVKHALMD